jgi:hypothetical protein
MNTLVLSIIFLTVQLVYGKKQLLSEIQSLTLTTGRMTTSRRSYSISQLACIGGPCHHSPNIIQCSNKGSDGYDIQWECKGEMDENYKFGRLDVVCEGYEYPNDPYILVGSCGLEYTIEYASLSYPEEVGIYSILITFIIIFGIASCCSSSQGYSSNRGWYSGLGTGAVLGSVASRGSYRSYGGRSRMRTGFSSTRRR